MTVEARVHITAIVAAGGRGERLNAGLPKQLLDLGGRSILQRSVDAFDQCDRVDEIIVAAPREWLSDPSKYLAPSRKPLKMVPGGARRQDSVASAFDFVDAGCDVVVVHDAARAFVSSALISRTIDAALHGGAAIAALPVQDTVKLAQAAAGDRAIESTLDRRRIFLAQTPQAFRYRVLAEAIAIGRTGRDATDEAELAEAAGHRVLLVEGEAANIKITTHEDLTLARRLAGEDGRPVVRIGVGYDLHRLVEGRPLVIGGVRIAHEKGLTGHSDADVLCHAVTDAILGAAALGDIGRHFPDTDAAWKDSDSLDLLRRAAALVGGAGWRIENLDAVIIAEQPRIAPHADEMRRRLAGALGIDASAISVKGKTNEGMDAVGRGEAIAAHAVALVGRR
jgi:2-C-methyl-D-erythritol 4-phosphate cytidylyltransferase/2-C-methyl-D-erythritol 2,4-cyclodiphosphate synthase